MPCSPAAITRANGVPGIFHRRRQRAASFHWPVEICRWLVSVSLVNYATTKTSQSSIGREHPPYRHESASKEADAWLPSPLPARRSCGDQDVQRQRIWRKTSRTTGRTKVQAVDDAPFAAEKVSGRIDSSRPEYIFRYVCQHSRNAGAKSPDLADVHPSIMAGAKKKPFAISLLLGARLAEAIPR